MNVKQIGLVAHDNQKEDLKEWVVEHKDEILKHKLVCTGTTGRIVFDALSAHVKDIEALEQQFTRLKSGPLGGDQQLGAMIVNGEIDALIFFWDPMQPQPHDVDVKALLRITALCNIPTACNRATADFLITSPLMKIDYKHKVTDYTSYVERSI